MTVIRTNLNINDSSLNDLIMQERSPNVPLRAATGLNSRRNSSSILKPNCTLTFIC